jgi:ketosteroid isomerase-like protein
MAKSNLEVVKAGYAAFAESGVDGIMELTHPNFEATTPPDLASEPDTYRGHEGVRRYWDSFYEAMDEIWLDGDEFIEAGDAVIVKSTLRARGRSSGIVSEQHAVLVWRVRDEKIIGVSFHPDLEAARAAADD